MQFAHGRYSSLLCQPLRFDDFVLTDAKLVQRRALFAKRLQKAELTRSLRRGMPKCLEHGAALAQECLPLALRHERVLEVLIRQHTLQVVLATDSISSAPVWPPRILRCDVCVTA
jgi:hypothetical protein